MPTENEAEKSGTTSMAAEARPIASPEAELAPAAAGTIAEKIEAVFVRHIRGSRLSHDTEMWNLVRKAFDEVKSLVA